MATKTGPKPDTTAHVPLDQLRLYERNPRKGNVGAVAASLQVNGQYRPLVVNIGTHTSKPNEVLKGNHTLRALRKLAAKHPEDERWHTALVHFVDVDAAQAAKIVAVDNRTSEKGSYDSEALRELLTDIDNSAEGLEGTGFSAEDLDAMRPSPPMEDPIVDPEALVDDPDPDAGPEDAPSGRGAPVISYSIVFDDIKQRQKWVGWLNWLKTQYPDDTPGERLANYLEERASAALRETEES